MNHRKILNLKKLWPHESDTHLPVVFYIQKIILISLKTKTRGVVSKFFKPKKTDSIYSSKYLNT